MTKKVGFNSRIDPGHRLPLHRHAPSEVYYILQVSIKDLNLWNTFSPPKIVPGSSSCSFEWCRVEVPPSTGLKTLSNLNLGTPYHLGTSIPYPQFEPTLVVSLQCTFHVKGCIHTIPLSSRSEQSRERGGHDCLHLLAWVRRHKTFVCQKNISHLTGATTSSRDPSTNGSSSKKCEILMTK